MSKRKIDWHELPIGTKAMGGDGVVRTRVKHRDDGHSVLWDGQSPRLWFLANGSHAFDPNLRLTRIISRPDAKRRPKPKAGHKTRVAWAFVATGSAVASVRGYLKRADAVQHRSHLIKGCGYACGPITRIKLQLPKDSK